MTTASTPSSAQAEAGAEQARACLVSTLDRLRENLQPAHVVEEVMGSARVSASAISNQIWDTARKNPLPALMIGAGLAMIFGLGGRAVSSLGSPKASASGGTAGFSRGPEFEAHVARPALVDREAPFGVDSVVSSAKAQASDLLDSANDTIANVASRAASLGRNRLSSMKAGASMTSGSRNNLLDGVAKVLEEQPLILAAIGIAVGAAIGAAIPQTETENSFMGESSHSVRDAAQGLIQDQYGQLKSAASHAIDDIKQSVADHGVTADNLTGLVHEVGEKAKAATYEAGRSLDPTKA